MSDINTIQTANLFSALGKGGATPKDIIKAVMPDGSKVTCKFSGPVASTTWTDIAAAADNGIIFTTTDPVGTLAQKLVRKAAHKGARAVTILGHIINGTSLDDTLTPSDVVGS